MASIYQGTYLFPEQEHFRVYSLLTLSLFIPSFKTCSADRTGVSVALPLSSELLNHVFDNLKLDLKKCKRSVAQLFLTLG